jgi:hypothetical protein
MSQLWYREMFLDRCKVAQFATDTSLPAILVEHAMKEFSLSVSQPEVVVRILDIYNDAADMALNSLRRKYVFDEIEGEFRVEMLSFLSRLESVVFRCVVCHGVF